MTYSETAGRLMIKHAKIIDAIHTHGLRARAIHHAMFKIAMADQNPTGIEVANGLNIQLSYSSEWNKIKNLVKDLRTDGTL